MLIRFRVANFRSIRDEQELSFVAVTTGGAHENTVHIEKYKIKLLRVLAVYGANASGKSNLLEALKFMRSAVINSQISWGPQSDILRKPFVLDKRFELEPSFFEVDFLEGGDRYTYGFILDTKRILEEWLYAYPQGKKQKWFVRDAAAPNEFSFSRFLSGENKIIQSLTRPNSLFLSAAAQNNHQVLAPVFHWFSKSITFVSERNRNVAIQNTAQVFRNSEYAPRILDLLTRADLGITGIDVEEEDLAEAAKKALEILVEDVSPGSFKQLPLPGISRPTLRHKTGDEGKESSLPFSDESHGTQVVFGLAGHILQTLSEGSVLCIDELDSGLHPLIAIEIVKLFNDEQQNPNNAQLVFNTHDTNILDSAGLRRDQIWFTEKDSTGATQVYSLTDYKPRKMENIKRGYLQGRYGGVPLVRPLDIMVEEQNGK